MNRPQSPIPSRSDRPALLLGMAAALFAACGGDDDDGPADAGTPTDTGTVDGGTPDTGTPDMTTPDMGMEPLPFAIHYHRPDLTYDGWSVEVGGDIENPGVVALSETDDFGAVFEITPVEGGSSLTFQFTNGTDVEPAEPISMSLDGADGVWWFHGSELEPLPTAPPAIPGEGQVAIYYVRGDGEYGGWGLHLWGDVQETAWAAPAPFQGIDPVLGAHRLVDVNPGGDRVNLIVHMGDLKDPGPDMGFDISELGDIVFVRSGSASLFTAPQFIPEFQIDGMAAHWVSAELVLFDAPEEASSVELRWSLDASIAVSEELDVVGGQAIELMPRTEPLPTDVAEKFPHIAERTAFVVPEQSNLAEVVRGQLVVVARDADGAPLAATGVQIPGVLDALFPYDGPLGASFDGQTPTLRVWAPTAQTMELTVYETDETELATEVMTLDPATGVWSVVGQPGWYGKLYRYRLSVFHPLTGAVETFDVTDPYSVSLSTNSAFSQIIDLENDPALQPPGWSSLTLPSLAAPEDVTIYEGHIRDFSVFDTSVPAADRGTYRAFTYDGTNGRPLSDGMRHLSQLAQAGLSVFHILPSFDLATIDEKRSARVEITDGFDRLCTLNTSVPMEDCTTYGSTPIVDVLASLDPSTDEAQQIVTWMAGLDGFNWGYDPFHYTVPEGSYASDPDGTARIIEFRQMVQSLAGLGLRVALDVVYNHTNASGPADKSVLDKVVPGYYHRLNEDTGRVELSTCCDNTATEHAMMEKLMVDSLTTWARAYKIGAFRFDLMGHHMVRNMIRAQAELAQIDPEIYLYGEGWDYGEVVNGRRGENASQRKLAGTGIGTFNDRIRDAVRGGGPFDAAADLRGTQGLATGLYYAPNELGEQSATTLEELHKLTDLTRLCMAGNLVEFKMVNFRGTVRTGFFIPYNGDPGGYTRDPQESVNYVSKHDNQTLFDIAAYKLATGTTMAERVRRHNLAVSTTVLGQGIPFLHMGVDLLRSKSMERDSYNSGDWFNRIDWTMGTNNWNVGLPNAEKDMGNYATIRPILRDSSIAPQRAHIEAAAANLRELLQLRSSSVLFRLRSKEQVMSRVDYHNVGPDQVPGLIVQSITDGTCAGDDMDPARDALIVVVNATPDAQTFDVGVGGFRLHPIQASSADPVVRNAQVTGTELTIPGLTTAVFELPQSGGQGAGMPCNTH